jgi:hypothetical protein
MDRLGAAEHVADHVGAVQPRRHALAVADVAVNERHVMHAIERRHIGVAAERTDLGADVECAHPFDQLVAVLPVGDQLGDRHVRKLVLGGEGRDLRAAHHRAVVIGKLGQHTDRRQAGQAAEIDAGFGMAGAHQHAALARNQRKHVAGAYKIAGAAVVVGERAHGVAALLGRDAGGEPVPHVDRNGKGGAERGLVLRYHQIEMQAARELRAERRTDDAGCIADDEGHLFRRAERGSHEQVALVLAIVVVGDHDNLALGECLDRGFDTLVTVGHWGLPRWRQGVNGHAVPSPT